MKYMNISNWRITSHFLCSNAEKTNYATHIPRQLQLQEKNMTVIK